ncbi:MAG: hypothetical protein U5L04_06060, partial [Trueperaceae bacterium]|nr:hypothetical protein [Trueperaceae bacterium]
MKRKSFSITGIEVKSYKKLNYDGITEQIKPYIFNKEKNKAVRSTAMDIARECMTPALENALVDVALNESEQVSFRALAAHIIANHASKDSKSKLTRLALDHISNDPDDEIKGSALKAVWPDHITTEELLGSLSPKRRGQHGVPWGSYGLFLNSDFEKHIPADDIDGALRWALDMFDNYGRGAENRFSFDWAISKVVYKGWEYLDRDGVLPLFARWAIRCIQNGVEITARLDEEKRKLEFQDDLKAHDNERHSLLKAIISELASYENQDSNEAQRSLGDLVEYYGIALVSDIPWLFDYSESAASKDEHNIALALITMLSYGLSTSTADPESREKVLKAATAKPGLAKLLGVG